MESNHHRRRHHQHHVFSLSLIPCILFFFFFAIFFSLVSSDINGDKDKCANQLVGLATCLPYVSGEAKNPTMDCCSGLKEVLKNSKECLCILVKDRNDPSLGLKINATLALSLPDKCHAPAKVGDVSQCPALLHLPPNSPDAKVFEDFAHGANGTHTSAPPAGGVGDSTASAKGSSTAAGEKKSDGGKTRMRIGVVSGFFLALLLLLLS